MAVVLRRRINTLVNSVFIRAGPDKKKPEDAYFTSDRSIAVADGVGGWSLQGVDPSLYSNDLVTHFGEAIQEYGTNISQALIKASKMTTAIGSSTFTGVILDPEKPKLYSANMGDSGFSIWRQGKKQTTIMERSKELTHDFNFPFQLGTGGDSPTKAIVLEHDVEESDYVLMYSDGFSDNLFDYQVLEILENQLSEEALPDLVNKLGEVTFKYSTNAKWQSPFSWEAKKRRYLYRGGKPDDITIILSKVKLNK